MNLPVKGSMMRVHLLGDFYPAGDEFDLGPRQEIRHLIFWSFFPSAAFATIPNIPICENGGGLADKQNPCESQSPYLFPQPLVYEVTKLLIPAAGLPKDVGCFVSNMESLINMARVTTGQPVIRNTLTTAGAVAAPFTAEAPIGVSYRDLIEMAGGVNVPDPVVMHGGMMMGRLGEDLDEAVSKTSSGIIVLDWSHLIMVRKIHPLKFQAAIGKSACD